MLDFSSMWTWIAILVIFAGVVVQRRARRSEDHYAARLEEIDNISRTEVVSAPDELQAQRDAAVKKMYKNFNWGSMGIFMWMVGGFVLIVLWQYHATNK